MRIAALAGLLAGFVFVGPGAGADRAPAPTSAADTVRVLVYNIHAGTDGGGRANLERVADVIREARADVVLLQEVDRGTERSGGVDQLGRLARRTGMHEAFGRTLDFQGGGYGIALLSRWPMVGDTLIHLPVEPVQERAGSSHEPRGALRAVVEAPGGPLRVVNTHLDASPHDRYRIQEVGAVLEAASPPGVEPPHAFVGGDFNDGPGSRVVDRMRARKWKDAWRTCGRGAGFTYPADAPDRRIDYLFLSGGFRCAGARVLETTASDHRPLLVRVVLEGEPGRATGRSPGSGPGRDAGDGGGPSP